MVSPALAETVAGGGPPQPAHRGAFRRDLHRHPEPGWTEFRTSGLVAHPVSAAHEVLTFFRHTTASLPDETTVIAELKPGLVYQDRRPVNGRPVLSEDIVVTQEYIRDDGTKEYETQRDCRGDGPVERRDLPVVWRAPDHGPDSTIGHAP
jgi:hypothetical protein